MVEPIGKNISVCILTYNHSNVIESTLESVLSQSIIGYEIIVSDDCSSDGTWERILDLARSDERIRPIQTPNNLGMAGNANFAVSHSVRPYVALLHHDDLYRNDLLEKWVGVLERNPDVSYVFNRYLHDGFEFSWPRPFKTEQIEGRRFLEKFLLARWGCPVRGTAMVRRESWNKVGGMRTEFGLVADVDLWMRLASISQVGYVPEHLITVRALRPDYYPDIYTGKHWHWGRLILVYNIHASNRRVLYAPNTVKGRLLWLVFRARVSCETAKWLVYALVKGKHGMISSSDESSTEYDLWPLRVFRAFVRIAFGTLQQLMS
jgi:glycosyltransferase involved in cell wall biosynthesis